MANENDFIDIEKMGGIKHMYAPGVEPRKDEIEIVLSIFDHLPGALSLLPIVGLIILALIFRKIVNTDRDPLRGKPPLDDAQRVAADDARARSLRNLRQQRQEMIARHPHRPTPAPRYKPVGPAR